MHPTPDLLIVWGHKKGQEILDTRLVGLECGVWRINTSSTDNL